MARSLDTSAMRPTRPAAVTTGMPVATPSSLPRSTVTVSWKFDGELDTTRAVTPRRSPAKSSRCRAMSSCRSRTASAPRMASPLASSSSRRSWAFSALTLR